MDELLSRTTFIVSNVIVWCAMTAILVVVPDTLERWMSLEIARVIGWGVAGSLWVVAVEPMWKARFGPFARFVLQLILWVGAALVAITISEQARLDH
jgi:hypothetical protein